MVYFNNIRAITESNKMINTLIHNQLFSTNQKSVDFKKFTESFNRRDITSLYIASSLEIGRESKLKMVLEAIPEILQV